MIDNTSSIEFACPLCDYTASKQNLYINHIRSKHNASDIMSLRIAGAMDLVRCDICNHICSNPAGVLKHKGQNVVCRGMAAATTPGGHPTVVAPNATPVPVGAAPAPVQAADNLDAEYKLLGLFNEALYTVVKAWRGPFLRITCALIDHIVVVDGVHQSASAMRVR